MEYAYRIRGPEMWYRWPMEKDVKYPGPWSHDNNGFYNYDPNLVLRKDLLASMHAMGLEPDSLNVFYTSPGKFVPIHVDGFNPNNFDNRRRNIAAINWAYSEFPWKMTWYSPQGDDSEYEHDSKFHYHNNSTNIDKKQYSYTRYIPEKMNVEYETSWPINPVLIRTNVPHNVTMLTEGPRWCASIRFKQDNYEYIREQIKTFLHNGQE